MCFISSFFFCLFDYERAKFVKFTTQTYSNVKLFNAYQATFSCLKHSLFTNCGFMCFISFFCNILELPLKYGKIQMFSNCLQHCDYNLINDFLFEC